MPGPLTHVCPDCGAVLAVKTNRATSEQFFGCSTYPKCTYTRPLTEDIKMRMAGAAVLPGMD